MIDRLPDWVLALLEGVATGIVFVGFVILCFGLLSSL